MGFEQILDEKKRDFESVLYTYFNGEKASVYEKPIYDAMAYSLAAGGKRLRPLLFLEAFSICMGVEEGAKAYDFAVALEMIHTYSLIHDDLPAMDNDDFRRGKPTNHKVFGEGMAVLAGDGLLNFAYELMLNAACSSENPRNCIQAAAHIAKAAGVHGMIGGQVVDMVSEGQAPNAQTLSFIHQHKTADLLMASVIGGGLLAGASDHQMTQLKDYGYHIGMAFQIVDDILDIVGDQAKLGKDIGSDQEKGKLTYPVVYGLEVSRQMATDHLQKAQEALAGLGTPSPFFDGLADFLLRRDH